MNAEGLPHWSAAARRLLLVQPFSAAAERVFSLMSNSFNRQQFQSLQDYIEHSLMLQYNKRQINRIIIFLTSYTVGILEQNVGIMGRNKSKMGRICEHKGIA